MKSPSAPARPPVKRASGVGRGWVVSLVVVPSEVQRSVSIPRMAGEGMCEWLRRWALQRQGNSRANWTNSGPRCGSTELLMGGLEPGAKPAVRCGSLRSSRRGEALQCRQRRDFTVQTEGRLIRRKGEHCRRHNELTSGGPCECRWQAMNADQNDAFARPSMACTRAGDWGRGSTETTRAGDRLPSGLHGVECWQLKAPQVWPAGRKAQATSCPVREFPAAWRHESHRLGGRNPMPAGSGRRPRQVAVE